MTPKERFDRWYAKNGKKRYQEKRKQILNNNKRWRLSEKGNAYETVKRKRYPDKIRARWILNAAVRKGILEKMSCEVCNKKPTHGHHEDYSKPLEVRWLCALHHREVHLSHKK